MCQFINFFNFFFAACYVKSFSRGRETVLLYFDNHTYHKSRKFKDGRQHWRCRAQTGFNCKASIYTIDDTIVKVHEKHNHEPVIKQNFQYFELFFIFQTLHDFFYILDLRYFMMYVFR